MSHFWTSTTKAEPPFGEGPGSPEEEHTLELEEAADAANAAEETLVGCELQEGKYRVLALRQATLAGAPLPGVSYTALHTDLQRRLTLRYLPLDPNASEEERDQTTMQFLREVRVLAKLDHPSLPRVHDYFCEGTACYVVMDELSERTLADVLAEAAQEGRMPALPPVMIAQIGVELTRALGYLHQQRPLLALGGLRAEDVALPADGPAQLTSLGALSMVASLPAVALSHSSARPTRPEHAPMTGTDGEAEAAAASEEAEEGLAREIGASAGAPEPGDDLYSLGVLLRELAGGAEVVTRVMDRLRRPDEALQAEDAEDVPPISLTLAAVIQVAAHDEPGRRFQSAAAFETALTRAWTVERRIVRQAERGGGDEQAIRLEDEEEDLEATSPEIETLEALQHTELATRQLPVVNALAPDRPMTICWRCAGHNRAGARVCRVCGARQPVPAGQRGRAASGPRRRARPTRRLLPGGQDESAWAEWNEDVADDAPGHRRQSLPSSVWLKPEGTHGEAQARRPTAPPHRQRTSRGASVRSPDGRRLLWGLVWTCFLMAFLLGGATIIVTYLALR